VKAQPVEDVRVLLHNDRPHYSLIISDSVAEALMRGEVIPELKTALAPMLRWKTPQTEREAV
jgi:hypothetical protein